MSDVESETKAIAGRKSIGAERLASPVEVEFAPGNEPRWYLPSLTESLGLMRWRVVYFLPAVLVVVLLVLLPAFPGFWRILLWWKLIVIVVALPIGAAINSAKHAIRLREEPFCIHCGYGATGLPDGHPCPECGNRFNLGVLEDYRRDPHWFIRRYNLRHSHPPTVAFDAGGKRSVKRSDGA